MGAGRPARPLLRTGGRLGDTAAQGRSDNRGADAQDAGGLDVGSRNAGQDVAGDCWGRAGPAIHPSRVSAGQLRPPAGQATPDLGDPDRGKPSRGEPGRRPSRHPPTRHAHPNRPGGRASVHWSRAPEIPAWAFATPDRPGRRTVEVRSPVPGPRAVVHRCVRAGRDRATPANAGSTRSAHPTPCAPRSPPAPSGLLRDAAVITPRLAAVTRTDLLRLATTLCGYRQRNEVPCGWLRVRGVIGWSVPDRLAGLGGWS